MQMRKRLNSFIIRKNFNFGENTPIEKYFSITDNIIIKVFYLSKVMNG